MSEAAPAADAERKAREALADQADKRAFRLQSLSRAKNVVELATAGIPGALCIEGGEIDQRPDLLACANGPVSLILGESVPPEPGMYLMRHANAEWHGIDAPCPTWDRFLFEILTRRAAMLAFLHRALGCAVWGAVVEHFLLMLVGMGRNGKSTLIEALLRILGGLAATIRAEVLLDAGIRNPNAPSPGDMSFFGRRLVFCSEFNETARFDTARIKWLTGGDTMRARNPFDRMDTTWQPTHTLLLSTNDKPPGRADDYAFWKRVMVIDFPLSFVDQPRAEYERKADPHLLGKLIAEGPGILAWLVRGCLEWQRIGLAPPPEVLEQTAAYRADVDPLGDFIEECITEDPVASTKAGDIYDLFSRWWQSNQGRNVPSPRWLNKRLKRRYTARKFGVLYFDGIKINPAAAAEIFSATGA
jgi:putative DNA primase/helicase